MDTQPATHRTETLFVDYAGYNNCRLVVRLSEMRLPAEVMFFVGPCLPRVAEEVAATADKCQQFSAALRCGTSLKELIATAGGIRPLPVKRAVTRLYGRTPAPVANDLTEWVLRHLALTYLSEDDCAELGIHKGFWCPACNQGEATRISRHSFVCRQPGCDWKYIN